MHKFANYLRKLQRNNSIYLIALLEFICVIIYIFAIRGLEKPAGLIEAFVFLFKNTEQYFLSMFSGIFAWVLSIIWLISIVLEIPIVKELLDDDYYNNGFENIHGQKMILNFILWIIMLIINIIFLKCLAAILLVVIVVIFLAYFLTNSN